MESLNNSYSECLRVPNIWSLELRHLWSVKLWYYKLVVGVVNVNGIGLHIRYDDSITGGHSVKLWKHLCNSSVWSTFFTDRVQSINQSNYFIVRLKVDVNCETETATASCSLGTMVHCFGTPLRPPPTDSAESLETYCQFVCYAYTVLVVYSMTKCKKIWL